MPSRTFCACSSGLPAVGNRYCICDLDSKIILFSLSRIERIHKGMTRAGNSITTEEEMVDDFYGNRMQND